MAGPKGGDALLAGPNAEEEYMRSGKFCWGKVIETFVFDMEGETLEITKYHPHKYESGTAVQGVYSDEVLYHVEDIRHSYPSLHAALIGWITYKRLGLNQDALVSGICRAIGI